METGVNHGSDGNGPEERVAVPEGEHRDMATEDMAAEELAVDQKGRLIAAAEVLRDEYAHQVAISTSRLVNPLLDLWGMAIEISPETAAPVERLLTVYAGPRELATPSELSELVERIRSTFDLAMV